MKVYQVSIRSEVILPRRQSPDGNHLPLKMASGGRLRGSAEVVKRPRMELKLVIPLYLQGLSQFPIWSLRNETPKILGSPFAYMTAFILIDSLAFCIGFKKYSDKGLPWGHNHIRQKGLSSLTWFYWQYHIGT